MGNACNKSEPKPPVETVDQVEEGKLTIKILGARGLRNADWMPGTGYSDCYCKVKALGAEAEQKAEGAEEETCLFQTRTINNSLTPLWQEEAQVMEFEDGADLEFSIWDEDTGGSADFLGKVVMKYDEFKDGFNGELKLLETKHNKSWLRVKVKMAGQDDFPEGPPPEFTIKIEKDPKAKKIKMHGLEVDDSDGKYLYVTNMKAGPFQTNNEKEGVHKMRPGDFFVKVNDIEGDSKAMLEELKTKTDFEIVARHADEITVAIDKKEAKAAHGLEFPKKPAGKALLITKVGDGPVKEWNDANEEHKVCDGDRIVSVAGFQGKAADLQKKLTSATACQLIVVRPADKDGVFW